MAGVRLRERQRRQRVIGRLKRAAEGIGTPTAVHSRYGVLLFLIILLVVGQLAPTMGAASGNTSTQPAGTTRPSSPDPTIPPPSPTGWTLGGTATVNPSGQLQLTADGQGFAAGSAYFPTAISPASLTATFDETISGGDPADGMAFNLLDAGSSTNPSTGDVGAALGFGFANRGRSVALVENARPWSCYPSDHFLGVADGTEETQCPTLHYLTTASGISALNGATHHVSITVNFDNQPTITVTFDGTQQINYADSDTTVPFPSRVFVGFSGGTGNGTETNLVSNVNISYVGSSVTPRLAALGDSYISGEGTYSRNEPFSFDYYGGEQGGSAYPQTTITGFNSDSASASDRCHRSPASYAPLTGVQQPDFVACSAATISDIGAGSSVNGEKSQLDVLNSQDTVVLLSAGGDDLGFSTVLTDCIDGPFGKHQSTNEGCRKSIEQARSLIPTMQDHLRLLLANIRATAPNAQIIQIGYPRLFPTGGTGSTCSGINNARQGWLNSAADQVASAISATDSSANADLTIGSVKFIDTRSVFAQHELCSGSAYVNDLQLLDNFGPFGPNNCPADYTVRGNPQVCSQSFHPNTPGYLAEANLVSSSLASG